ncbi:putative mitochondrial import receptor subunit tom70 [Psilocybe cubensis]|uniref:Mitochondrial import receptor subunit tom70 n=2 Tax=Psilocybe cubensis TaxID=181762 RepID=A0ACB8GI99_PSICU|nr:putative mitochondrial import receptor subunit tom70 [Psilocybe cubensis]KAH9475329.1 putative mitochondrial import receptor subunit tom70 [Psilocybe cubensis]
MAPISTPDAASPSIIERVQDFVGEHKKTIAIAAAAVAVAGVGVAYYASTSKPAAGGGAGDAVKSKEKKKKTGSKGAKKGSKKTNDADGPILEERKPKSAKVEDEKSDTYYDKLSAEEIASLPEQERSSIATSLKARGNAAYQARNFNDAAEFYTRAIQISPTPEPVFYSNRAACYVNMSPPKHELVVEDCDSALKLDPKYIKALNRRAMALEGLGRLEESLRDFTSATILDRFQNQTTANAVERVLKVLATEKAAAIMKEREPRLPSYTFISAYFAAFRPRALPTLPENPTTGDQTLLLGMQALEAADYVHAVTLINESIEQGISWDKGRAEALNLRGTFKFLMGEIPGAKADLEESVKLEPTFTQSLVKIASVHMEQGDPKAAFEAFEQAEKANSSDPDVWYHRGQVLFIMNEFQQAADNYTKSTELDENFVFSHIQLAVAQYKMGELAKSMATFRKTLRLFPTRSEPSNYYGELLLDQQRFEEAVEKFDRAIELEKNKTPSNVLPLVNKGLALYQWKQDIGAAERCCNEALRIDTECEAAVATLAQLSLQQSKIPEAVKMFERQAELARSEPELVSALTYQYATSAQVEFLKTYPDMAAQLNAIAQGMMGPQ